MLKFFKNTGKFAISLGYLLLGWILNSQSVILSVLIIGLSLVGMDSEQLICVLLSVLGKQAAKYLSQELSLAKSLGLRLSGSLFLSSFCLSGQMSELACLYKPENKPDV